jgi:hypothetical protein
MKGLSDTSPEAQRVLIECYRRMTPAQKVALIEDANRTNRLLHEAGFRARYPDATPEQIHLDWIRKTLGPEFADLAEKEWPMTQPSAEGIRVAREVMEALRRTGVACVLGGSFASGVHGISRSTRDADIMAEPFSGREIGFVAYLGPEYYADIPAIRDAIRNRSSFNVIHKATAFKADVFIRKDRPFDFSVLRRRTPRALTSDPADLLDILSPEDSILLKLEWYRLGGEVSDRQWNDVIEVMQQQRGQLDDGYLDQWAADLGVTDLLQQARTEAAAP